MDGLCLKVHKSKGEALRANLAESGFYDKERKIVKDGDYLYIPVNMYFDPVQIPGGIENNIKLVEFECPQKKEKIKNYRQQLSGKISVEQAELLPRAFDAIGHIALIKLPDELDELKFDIGESIINSNKHIKTVYRSTGIHHEFRLPKLELIAGEDSSLTTHTEFGIHLDVDVKKVYFSPRLATERYRVASESSSSEIVLDMFAGVGPFTIMIAKLGSPERLSAVDINPEAVKLMKRNIERNSVSGIDVHEGDAKRIVPTLPESGDFQRIIMNLPHSAFEFLPEALSASRNGGLIHYYEIFDHSELEQKSEELVREGKRHNTKLEIIAFRKVHTYSPTESLIGFDITVRK